MQSYYFVYWTYIKKTCEWGPVYIDKNFPGVTLPALVNLRKCLYMKNGWALCASLEVKTALAHGLILSPWSRWPGLIWKVTLPSKKRSSPLFVSSVFKRQVSVRKCRKFWLAQGSWGTRVTLLLGATLLPCSSWKTSRYWRGKILTNKVWNLARKQKNCDT